MKKIVLVLLVVMMAVGTAFAVEIDGDGDGNPEYIRIDLHPYGGKGYLEFRNNNWVIHWDNGNIYDIPDNQALAMQEMM
jgi:predicted porin